MVIPPCMGGLECELLHFFASTVKVGKGEKGLGGGLASLWGLYFSSTKNLSLVPHFLQDSKVQPSSVLIRV